MSIAYSSITISLWLRFLRWSRWFDGGLREKRDCSLFLSLRSKGESLESMSPNFGGVSAMQGFVISIFLAV